MLRAAQLVSILYLPTLYPCDSHHRWPWLTIAGPLLLACSDPPSKEQQPWKQLPPHKDEHQVGLDVNRAFVYYPKNGEIHHCIAVPI